MCYSTIVDMLDNVDREKMFKKLTFGLLLLTVTPLSLVGLSFSSSGGVESNGTVKINEEEILQRRISEVRDFAQSKNIEIDKLRGENDKSGMLAPRYNGGSIRGAVKRIEKIYKEETDTVTVQDKNVLSILIEFVSIGKKIDFSAGAAEMVLALGNCTQKDGKNKDKIEIDNVENLRKRGLEYVAAFVVQEMLIDIRDGEWFGASQALNNSYKKACRTVKSFLWMIQYDSKNINKCQANCHKSKSSWLDVDLKDVDVYKTGLIASNVTAVFGEFIGEKEQMRCQPRFFGFARYLHDCVKAGMAKFANECAWKQSISVEQRDLCLALALECENDIYLGSVVDCIDNGKTLLKDIKSNKQAVLDVIERYCTNDENAENFDVLKEKEAANVQTWVANGSKIRVALKALTKYYQKLGRDFENNRCIDVAGNYIEKLGLNNQTQETVPIKLLRFVGKAQHYLRRLKFGDINSIISSQWIKTAFCKIDEAGFWDCIKALPADLERAALKRAGLSDFPKDLVSKQTLGAFWETSYKGLRRRIEKNADNKTMTDEDKKAFENARSAFEKLTEIVKSKPDLIKGCIYEIHNLPYLYQALKSSALTDIMKEIGDMRTQGQSVPEIGKKLFENDAKDPDWEKFYWDYLIYIVPLVDLINKDDKYHLRGKYNDIIKELQLTWGNGSCVKWIENEDENLNSADYRWLIFDKDFTVQIVENNKAGKLQGGALMEKPSKNENKEIRIPHYDGKNKFYCIYSY